MNRPFVIIPVMRGVEEGNVGTSILWEDLLPAIKKKIILTSNEEITHLHIEMHGIRVKIRTKKKK
jgi:hypothetical protein